MSTPGKATCVSLHEVQSCVLCRVDEFKQQLYFLHQNIASNSDKTQELYENTQQLTALFHKIDQMEVWYDVTANISLS